MKKQAIVNLATGPHLRGQDRLVLSLKNTFDGHVFAFQSESDVDAPLHSDNPYAFKIYAIEKVRNMGFDQILWLDASVFAIRPVRKVFNWIEKNGVFMEEAGHWTGTWTPDYVRKYFNVSRTSVNKMPMFSAGFTGIDFSNPVGIRFFEEWKRSMLAGMFIGSWANHRHDMTCGSIIANLQGLDKSFSPGCNFFAYIGEGYPPPKKTAIFHVQGL